MAKQETWRFEAADNLAAALPDIMQQAGLVQVVETTQYATIVRGISLFRARKRPS